MKTYIGLGLSLTLLISNTSALASGVTEDFINAYASVPQKLVDEDRELQNYHDGVHETQGFIDQVLQENPDIASMHEKRIILRRYAPLSCMKTIENLKDVQQSCERLFQDSLNDQGLSKVISYYKNLATILFQLMGDEDRIDGNDRLIRQYIAREWLVLGRLNKRCQVLKEHGVEAALEAFEDMKGVLKQEFERLRAKNALLNAYGFRVLLSEHLVLLCRVEVGNIEE